MTDIAQKLRTVMEQWIRRYGRPAGRFGPELWVEEVLGACPDRWQRRVMRAYAKGKRRISVRSGHGVGKSTVLAWLALYQLVFWYPQKTVITAPTSGQLFDALWSEIVAWHRKLPDVIRELAEVKSDRIELRAAPESSFISARTSRAEKPEALAGVHSEAGRVLLIGDEASGIPDPIFEAAGGSMSGTNATTILAGNPVRSGGMFFMTHHELAKQWFTLHVSTLTSPRVSPDFVEQMRLQYGENSNAFRVRVLGEFPLADDDTIIPYELIVSAMEREMTAVPSAPMVWGLDVARFGGDRTVLVKRKGNVVPEVPRHWRGLDLMQTSAVVHAEWEATTLRERPTEILVDSIGLGAGVVDRLRQLGLPARGVNVSETPGMKELYLNLRVELWFKARQWFAQRDVSIPKEAKTLERELAALRYRFTASQKMQAEGKDELKRRMPLLGSPDEADAFVLTFASTAATAIGGTRKSWSEPIRRNLGRLRLA